MGVSHNWKEAFRSCKVAKHFLSNRQDAGPKIDPKRKILWMSADPFWSLNIPLELHIRIRPANAPVWPIVSVFPRRIPTQVSQRNEETPEGQQQTYFPLICSIAFWTPVFTKFNWIPGRRKYVMEMYRSICIFQNKWKGSIQKGARKERGRDENRAEVGRNTDLMDSPPEVTGMCYPEHECRSSLSICWVFWKQCQYNYACCAGADGAESNLTFIERYRFIILEANWPPLTMSCVALCLNW